MMKKNIPINELQQQNIFNAHSLIYLETHLDMYQCWSNALEQNILELCHKENNYYQCKFTSNK